MPPLQRTNSMPAGQIWPMIIVSWPAPEGRWNGLVADRHSRRVEAGDDAGIADIGRRLVGLRERQAERCGAWRSAAATATMSETARRRHSSRGARMSIENRTRPGITLTAPGSASSRPTVATRSCSSRAARLDREDHFGARGERVLPQRHRHRAGMAGEALDGRGEAGRAIDRADRADRETLGLQHRALLDMQFDEGVDAARAQLEQLFGIAAEVDERILAASRRPCPSAPRQVCGTRPASAREPVIVVGKRTPSSSPKATTSIAKSSRSPASCNCSTTASAASAPRLPS